MFEKMIRRFVAVIITVQVVMMITLVAVLAGLGYAGYLGVQHVRAARQLDVAKTALIREASGFCNEADRRILEGWAKVGETYLTQREMGRIDEMLRGSPEKDFWARNDIVLAVRERMRDHFRRSTGHYAISPEELEALEPRLKCLYDANEAKHEVYLCGTAAEWANSKGALEALQENFEAKKKELVRLLRLVSDLQRQVSESSGA